MLASASGEGLVVDPASWREGTQQRGVTQDEQKWEQVAEPSSLSDGSLSVANPWFGDLIWSWDKKTNLLPNGKYLWGLAPLVTQNASWRAWRFNTVTLGTIPQCECCPGRPTSKPQHALESDLRGCCWVTYLAVLIGRKREKFLLHLFAPSFSSSTQSQS